MNTRITGWNEGEDWEENDAIRDSYCMGEMSLGVFLFSVKP